MPERRAGDVVRVEERVVRALGLLPPKEPAVLGGREGLAQRRAKGVHVGELARRGGRKAHEVLGPRGAAGSESDHAALLQNRGSPVKRTRPTPRSSVAGRSNWTN